MTKLSIAKELLVLLVLLVFWKHGHGFSANNQGITDEELLNITIPLNHIDCYLISNDLTRIPSGYFLLPNLQILQLHANDIAEIQDDSFVGELKG